MRAESEINSANTQIQFDATDGEMKTIASPLRKVNPRLLDCSPFSISFALSNTTLMWMSNAKSVPTN